jgi:HSP20 family molecular chaperone IbpA
VTEAATKLPIRTEAAPAAPPTDANLKSGVLTVTLPKSPEAQKSQKTIPVNAK